MDATHTHSPNTTQGPVAPVLDVRGGPTRRTYLNPVIFSVGFVVLTLLWDRIKHELKETKRGETRRGGCEGLDSGDGHYPISTSISYEWDLCRSTAVDMLKSGWSRISRPSSFSKPEFCKVISVHGSSYCSSLCSWPAVSSSFLREQSLTIPQGQYLIADA